MLRGYLFSSTTNYGIFNYNTAQGEWNPDLKLCLMPNFSNSAKITCNFAWEAYWLEFKKRFVKKMLIVEEMAKRKNKYVVGKNK